MRMMRFLTLPFLALLLSFGAAQAVEQDFVKPKVGIFRLDWCRVWGADCGKPAADKFCQTKGFTQSNNFEIAADIGASTPTVVIGTGQQCADATCDGFTFVTCEKPDAAPPPPPLPPPPGPAPGGSGGAKKYFNPKVGGARLNLCLKKGLECDGEAAADAYCEAKGWDQSSDFDDTGPLPPFVKSRFIGNGKICKGPSCTAFSSITCENN